MLNACACKPTATQFRTAWNLEPEYNGPAAYKHVMTSEHTATADGARSAQPAGVPSCHQRSTVARVLLGTSPSSALARKVLRPLHPMHSSGRAAALRTIQHLPLHRAHKLGVTISRQLEVLAAADQATALTIHSRQIEGLLEVLEQQQQLERDLAALEATLNHILDMESSLRGAATKHVPASSSSTTATATTSSTKVLSSSSSTTGSSSNSSSGGGSGSIPVAAGTQPSLPGAPAAKPKGPHFRHITVVGPLPAPTLEDLNQDKVIMQQLVRLLDVLPGTQHLDTLVLSNLPADDDLPTDLYWDKHVQFSEEGLLAPQGAFAAALPDTQPPISGPPKRRPIINKSRSGNTTTRGVTYDSTSSNRPSWRSSCRVLLVGRHKARMSTQQLSHLLMALEQLQGAVLQGMNVLDLALLAMGEDLRPLRALQLSDIAGMWALDALLAARWLTNLRHLGISNCMNTPFDFTTVPAAYSALVALTSLDLSNTYITGEGLEGACGITSLRTLDLSFTSFCSFLPNAVSQLTALEELDLWYSAVRQLPEALTALTSLRDLRWGGFRGGSVRVDDLWQLTSLQYLRLCDNTLLCLPGAISCLTALTGLHILSTSLQQLPASISALVGLQRLDLFSRSLQGLPETITVLTQLTSIKLGHCDEDQLLQEAPEAVCAFVTARQAAVW